jgi:hypothetical protein
MFQGPNPAKNWSIIQILILRQLEMIEQNKKVE